MTIVKDKMESDDIWSSEVDSFGYDYNQTFEEASEFSAEVNSLNFE